MFKRITVKITRLKQPSLWLVSVLLLLFIGAADVITGPELSVSIFYLLPITIAAWFISANGGLILAVLSTCVWLTSDLFYSRNYSYPVVPYWNMIVMLGIFSVVTVLISRLKAALEREQKLAAEIQRSLLPKHAPELPGFKVHCAWLPAAAVSGDYYDFINVGGGKTAIALGDVCGHGFPAALLMSNLQASVRILANSSLRPGELCGRLNDITTGIDVSDRFISFFYGILNVYDNTIEYTNAGHPSPIVIRNHSGIIRLPGNDLVLGVLAGFAYQSNVFQLCRGDVIIFFTDGIVEAKNAAGDEFGENRLIHFCQKFLEDEQDKFTQCMINELEEFTGGCLDDDITLVVIKVD